MYYTILVTLTKDKEAPVQFPIDWISHSLAWNSYDIVYTHKSIAAIINELRTIYDTAKFAFELSGSNTNDALWTIMAAQRRGESLDIQVELKSAATREFLTVWAPAIIDNEALSFTGKVVDVKPQAGHSYIASFDCTGEGKAATYVDQ